MLAEKILKQLLADLEVFAEFPEGADPPAAYGQMHEQGIYYQPAEWFNRTDPTFRMACSRAMRRLEDKGMIVRVVEPGRDRVRYVRLTAAGLEEAYRLAGISADPQAIREGLRRTLWGRPLATNFGGEQ